MGQNVYGLPKGIATALDEIARNTVLDGRVARRKYKSEDDYYNEMVLRGKYSSFGIIKDPLRRRMFKRAKERYMKDYPRGYKLATAEDMYNHLVQHGITSLHAVYNSTGVDIERHKMAQEAEARYRAERINQMKDTVSEEDLKDYK